jgi:uracil phosphoribosyltransferase
MVTILSNTNSLANVFLSELRDKTIQKDSMRFRKNLERLGEIFAYEISKKMDYEKRDVITPLGTAAINLPLHQPVIATILRAGLPLHQGILNYFDKGENAFISAYRRHHINEETFDINVEYLSSPQLDGRELILCDPMLASGASMVLVYKALKQKGIPKQIHVVSVISSAEGLEHVRRNFPDNTRIWIGAVDDEMTAQAYIVPGLGDAGDLAFGEKF